VDLKGGNSKAVSGLGYRKDFVGTGRAVSSLYSIYGLTFRGLHFQCSRPVFQLFRLAFPESLN